MSNETKRDVFGQLLNAYQNLIVKDIEIHDENYRENITTPWNIVYDAALPDDLPVIPKSIGNFIKQSVYEDATLQEALECAHDKQFGVGRWISAHSEIFARAWLLGVWRVEETGEIVKLEAEK